MAKHQNVAKGIPRRAEEIHEKEHVGKDCHRATSELKKDPSPSYQPTEGKFAKSARPLRSPHLASSSLSSSLEVGISNLERSALRKMALVFTRMAGASSGTS